MESLMQYVNDRYSCKNTMSLEDDWASLCKRRSSAHMQILRVSTKRPAEWSTVLGITTEQQPVQPPVKVWKWGGFHEKLTGLLACLLIGSSPLLPHLALTADPRDAPMNFSKHCSSELMLCDICFSILHGFGGSGSDISLIEDNDEERRTWARSLCACFTSCLKHKF